MANKKPLKDSEIVALVDLLAEVEQEEMCRELKLTNAQLAKVLIKRSGIVNITGDVVSRLRNKRYNCLQPKPEPEPEPEPEQSIEAEAIDPVKWQNLVLKGINSLHNTQVQLADLMDKNISLQAKNVELFSSFSEIVSKFATKIVALDAKMDQMMALIIRFYRDCGGKVDDNA